MNASDPITTIAGEHLPAGALASSIVEFSPIAAALADLASRYAGQRYEVSTKDGMHAARTARRELRELRVDIEKRRETLKAPIIARGRLLDSEAKRITAALSALEDPIDAQIKSEEQRAERERAERERHERERVAAIDARIAWIRRMPAEAAARRTSADLSTLLAMLRALPIDAQRYAEKLDAAGVAHREAVELLEGMVAAATAREAEAARLAEQRAELARQEAEAKAKRDAEDRERRERQAREDAERAAKIAAEDAERARLRTEDEARAAAVRAEQERVEREAREAREREEATARAERERQAREVAEHRQRERERLEAAADPWQTIDDALGILRRIDAADAVVSASLDRAIETLESAQVSRTALETMTA